MWLTVDSLGRPGGALSVVMLTVIVSLITLMLSLQNVAASAAADVMKPCKVSNINVQQAVDWSRVRYFSFSIQSVVMFIVLMFFLNYYLFAFLLILLHFVSRFSKRILYCIGQFTPSKQL